MWLMLSSIHPPPCKSNTKTPKFDGNNTLCCSDKGCSDKGGGGFTKGKIGHGSKIAETTPTVALTSALLSQMGGGGGQCNASKAAEQPPTFGVNSPSNAVGNKQVLKQRQSQPAKRKGESFNVYRQG